MSDLDAAFAKAVTAHQAGDFAAAERMYRGILQAYPAHAPTLCNLGVLLVRAGKLDQAAECYHLALAAAPGHPDAHFNLGNLYRRANRLREAAEHYRGCLAASPQHPAATRPASSFSSGEGASPINSAFIAAILRIRVSHKSRLVPPASLTSAPCACKDRSP